MNRQPEAIPPSFPRIPGYEITERLYNSSRTAVYRALHVEERRQVAIKVLQKPYPSFNEIVQFRNQYAIHFAAPFGGARNLDFPGILRPLNLIPWQNSYALVLEDDGSLSLAQFLQHHRFSVAKVLQIALQLTDILHYLHSQRVIHKDIKPANILIHPDTERIKLIDFSIASLLPKETQKIHNPNVLEGTLAYIAPEQTGRMNRAIDYRADFYSLGATLYELLTGQLPFLSTDPLELVHHHIAELPVPPHQVNPEIPPLLSAIVLKLMAKNAEDRYQSALGLKSDLEQGLQQWQESGKIAEFELGKRDWCDRFVIPEKLYGRKFEVAQVLAAFDRVSGRGGALRLAAVEEREELPLANSELLLVAGYSGIGKTAVINEVHKPITRQKGYFVAGKFDQFNRNIPLSAFVQALQDLIEQLLCESEAQLQRWRARLLEAVGESGQLLIDIIPDLESIIGPQPPAVELLGNSAQHRFKLLLKAFINVFATREHPLVIFLDDLQWADSDSLQLLGLLMKEQRYLLLLGAYRDNEVNSEHPLNIAVDALKKSGKGVNTISLSALSFEDLQQWIVETLHCSRDRALPLVRFIDRTTQRNPFFVQQLLKTLHDNELLKFQHQTDCERGYWDYNLEEIEARSLGEDLVESIAMQLQQLPQETQTLVKLAACIGYQFDLETLATVARHSKSDTASALWSAIQERLILPQTDAYKYYFHSDERTLAANVRYRFVHDRVQQAAYSLIPERQKARTHHRIGQLLLQKLSPQEQEEEIFQLVNHFNYAPAKIKSERQRYQCAILNLIAARKARATMANQIGLNFAEIGLLFLGEAAWQQHYQETLELYQLAIEFSMWEGKHDRVESLLEKAKQQANCLADEIQFYGIEIRSKILNRRFQEALDVSLSALEKLGIIFPENPTLEEIDRFCVDEVFELLGDKKIEDLAQLPYLKDREKILVSQIISISMPAAFVSSSPLYYLFGAALVKFSIQEGLTPEMSIIYATYSIMMFKMLKNQDLSIRFGKVAQQIAESSNNKSAKVMTNLMLHSCVFTRKEPIRENLKEIERNQLEAFEIGDVEAMGNLSNLYLSHSFWCGNELNALALKAKSQIETLRKYGLTFNADNDQKKFRTIRILQGEIDLRSLLHEDPNSARDIIVRARQDKNYNLLSNFYTNQVMLFYLFGEIEAAKAIATEGLPYIITTGLLTEANFYFYETLSRLADADVQLALQLPPEARPNKLWEEIVARQHQLQREWADRVPANYQHKVDLIEAEKCRVLGKNYEAGDWYDRAITGARTNGFLHEEALANELAAKFYLTWGLDSARPNGKEKVASGYLKEAYTLYARWGATAKVAHLERNYPHLVAPHLFPTDATESTTISQSMTSSSRQEVWLDFPALMKAASAISESIELEQLLATLMNIALSNAGAQNGTLLLHREGNWQVVARALGKKIESADIPLAEASNLPQRLIYRVARSQKTAVFDNLSTVESFASDPYVRQQQPKSVLCTPIRHQGELIALLYLENNLAIGAFTRDRVEILQLLARQAGISIENARLYRQVQDYSQTLELEVERKTEALDRKARALEDTIEQLQHTQAQLIQTEKMSSLGQLVAGIAHEINNPINFINGNLSYTQDYGLRIIKLLELYQKELPNPSPELLQYSQEIEIDFLVRDMPKILTSMKKGSDRISKIVESLRNFSRLDESAVKTVALCSGIESTLLILSNRLQATQDLPEIAILKEYCPLPPVTCYPSQLNQVFLNIINNAIDAIRENPAARVNPYIRLRTEILEGERVRIAIANSDSAIPEAIREKIFDPFFTTKPVGRGTGLGLFTSYSIIKQHQGSLSVRSTEAGETEFAIVLPVQPQP